jgi:hypothetical protein
MNIRETQKQFRMCFVPVRRGHITLLGDATPSQRTSDAKYSSRYYSAVVVKKCIRSINASRGIASQV